MTYRTAVISILCLILTACSTPKPPPPVVEQHPPQSTGVFSQDYINRLEELCYAQIQRTVGETRAGRGVIWAECMRERVRPIEQKNYPVKADDIARMYDALVWDMQEFYRGHTTLNRLHERWALRQKTIGYEHIRSFHDSYM